MAEWATPRDLAADAAERIRDLNHATLDPATSYRVPADVDATLAELEVLAQRLPQALDQARKWLLTARTEGRVGDDRADVDGRITVERATARLEVCAARARALAEYLADTRTNTSHLTGIDPGGDHG